ncbi:hypothetical protein OWR29_39550 [Actinoplanes sp. Pm04-4]|uniref:Uncharacterized protein n=1 Tax=Paractinoplanes pyxinae TaxID=2997416 RepID=A0ABT4BC83_9ACTN|nr:hypothetical protein [Actinoplanes pyxinae]MCY1144128.1 hypothetical protein [Actinoplanes pyxinae]
MTGTVLADDAAEPSPLVLGALERLPAATCLSVFDSEAADGRQDDRAGMPALNPSGGRSLTSRGIL